MSETEALIVLAAALPLILLNALVWRLTLRRRRDLREALEDVYRILKEDADAGNARKEDA